MGLGSVLKRTLSGVAHGAQAVAGDVAQAVQPSAAPQSPAMSAPNPYVGFDVPDFKLPDLDPADPDYKEKKAIHDAYEELGSMHQQHVAQAGSAYQTMYNNLAHDIKARPQGKEFSPLSAFAIGLGNPDALKNVAAHNDSVTAGAAQKDSDLLALKEQALKGQIQQMMSEGKFAQALKQSAMLADVQAMQSRSESERAHKNKLEEINTTQDAMTKRTNIISDRMRAVADSKERVARSVGAKLPAPAKAKMDANIAKAKQDYGRETANDPLTGEAVPLEQKAAATKKFNDEIDMITDDAIKELGLKPASNAPADTAGLGAAGIDPEAAAAEPANAADAAAVGEKPVGVKMKKGNVTRMVSPAMVARAKELGYSEVK
jgi:hypothetical protein